MKGTSWQPERFASNIRWKFTIADIESVVVSSKCRGRGYGKELMTAMIESAKKMNVHHIQLTSNPARVAANQMYLELGVERYDTIFIRKRMIKKL